MRRLAYLLTAAAMVLVGLTLLRTNLLASDGAKLRSLTTQKQEKLEKISVLEQRVMELQSLSSVKERAEAMGLSEATRIPLRPGQHLAEKP